MKKRILGSVLLLCIAMVAFTQDSKEQLKQKLNDGKWVISWFVDVLQFQDREAVKRFVPNIEDNTLYDDAFEKYIYWYERDNFKFEQIRIEQGRVNRDIQTLRVGKYHEIIISECIIINDLFKSKGTEGEDNDNCDDFTYLNWSSIRKYKSFTLIFVFDGDYLSVYLNKISEKTLFATFCRFDDATLAEFENLIYTNTPPDLSKVTWPHRVNGSMDSPSKEATSDNPTTKSSAPTVQQLVYPYVTTAYLRLRESPSRSAKEIMTIKQGTRLVVLSKGAEELIDDIRAPWVQVKTETGETGWCFGGYLDPKP